ncbi:MAG: haloacid dehalogenase-like hydrolase, partial [Candidatus Eisenbacteria bacterium]|nr:haloacid dehalogenase-like hydrolase [Candidatus Eisenbacteria bacterium]
MSSRILIFDNDGTLVPSHLVANPAIQEAFARFSEERRLGLPAPSDARIRELTGQPGDAFYRALLPERLQHLAAELRNFCLDREVAEMRRAATFYPGIEEMLHACRARGDRLVLASHGGERYIGAVAERLRYADLFDRVYHHGFEGMQEKTEMARRARSELGPGRPAVIAGDRRADLLAARAARTRF